MSGVRVSVDEDVRIDDSWQYWDERPAAQDDDEDGDLEDSLDEEAESVVYATPPDVDGEISAENVPVPDGGDPAAGPRGTDHARRVGVVNLRTSCCACGAFTETSKFDITSESGAVIVSVCSECESRLSAERCAVCGITVDPDREESIGPHGSGDGFAPLCPSCRRDIVYGDGGEFR